MPKHLVAIADIPQIDEVQSDSSDDTTCSTWRAPPQELKGNKYRNEMKVGEVGSMLALYVVMLPIMHSCYG